MKRKILLTMLLCGFSAFLSASSPLLVRDGKPEAVIVIPEKASLTEEFAASQLRYWLREITGAELEITGKPADGKTGIFLGRSFAEKMFPDDIRKLDGTEGFAIREKDGNLYFFCGLPCGLNFAVYDFLEKNTDIIWPCYRTGFDRVFTPVRTLSANVCDYRRSPRSGNAPGGSTTVIITIIRRRNISRCG